MSKFETAIAAATAAGHVLEHDPPHAMSSMRRYTCKLCGRAVLGNADVAYGGATEGPCSAATVKKEAKA